MKVMGFNFTKLNAEKSSDNFSNLQIKTHIDISSINELKADSFKIKENLFGVKFSYIVEYSPEVAKLEFEGNVLFAIDVKLSKEIIKQWKDKKIQEDFRIFLFNIILKKSNLKALQLEEELNLPLHISLPSLKKQEND